MNRLALVLAALAPLFTPVDAAACDWLAPNDVFHMAEQAGRIGVVEGVDWRTARVVRSLRGPKTETVAVASDNCNPRFEKGARYLLFLSAEGQVISDSSAARLGEGEHLLEAVEAFIAAPDRDAREPIVEAALREAISRAPWTRRCGQGWVWRLMVDARTWRGPAGLEKATRAALAQVPDPAQPCVEAKPPRQGSSGGTPSSP